MFCAWLIAAQEAVTATVTAGASTGLTALPLASKGLLTTLFGLVGVFLVLLLFFFAIKLLQNFGSKRETTKE
ncbi:MAG: hypothetical protein LLF96_05815 [Eubacteriales bacterium]|nr:hypothetical protein [Eubacteriales bacterium]